MKESLKQPSDVGVFTAVNWCDWVACQGSHVSMEHRATCVNEALKAMWLTESNYLPHVYDRQNQGNMGIISDSFKKGNQKSQIHIDLQIRMTKVYYNMQCLHEASIITDHLYIITQCSMIGISLDASAVMSDNKLA